MKKLGKESKFAFTGTLLGLILGFIYYFYFGCENGCAIKSNPWLMTIYGGIIGYLAITLLYLILNSKK